MRPDILIFCDGGLGNRINALASGLAIARHFGLTYCVHWPINNWCAAPFEKIFANRLNVSTESISQLRGKLDDAVMLLHDEIASSTLNVKFESAYRFKDLKDFGELTNLKSKSVFYYPAVTPNWVPEELVHNELRFLKFNYSIVKEVKEFISNTMPGPFYGLHLRRTDLNVGLSDLEVFNLAKAHPDAAFFVCSDDPQAESLAAGHSNVYRRKKNFHVEKKMGGGDWLVQMSDDDGRLYYGNIQRDEDAVVEGAIDMLILAHSQIVGYSGSTFQKNASLIGLVAPITDVQRPLNMYFLSNQEIERKILTNQLSSNLILNLTDQMTNSGNKFQSINLVNKSIWLLTEDKALEYFNILALDSLSEKNYTQSILYFEYISKLHPENPILHINLAYIYLLVGRKDLSLNSMKNFTDNRKSLKVIDNNLKKIIDFVESKLLRKG
jgi:hypothetical protein